MSYSLAKINLTALAHNIETVRARLPRGVKILFAVKGRYAPVIGTIGLGHTAIDITGIAGIVLGEEVEVFGPRLPADRLAKTAGLAVCELLVPALQGATDRTFV